MCKVRPTVITSTPRIFAMIHNEYLQDLYQEYQIYIKGMWYTYTQILTQVLISCDIHVTLYIYIYIYMYTHTQTLTHVLISCDIHVTLYIIYILYTYLYTCTYTHKHSLKCSYHVTYM